MLRSIIINQPGNEHLRWSQERQLERRRQASERVTQELMRSLRNDLVHFKTVYDDLSFQLANEREAFVALKKSNHDLLSLNATLRDENIKLRADCYDQRQIATELAIDCQNLKASQSTNINQTKELHDSINRLTDMVKATQIKPKAKKGLLHLCQSCPVRKIPATIRKTQKFWQWIIQPNDYSLTSKLAASAIVVGLMTVLQSILDRHDIGSRLGKILIKFIWAAWRTYWG